MTSYQPNDSEYGDVYRNYLENGAKALEGISAFDLDEYASVTDSHLNTPAYENDADLRRFRDDLAFAQLRAAQAEREEAEPVALKILKRERERAAETALRKIVEMRQALDGAEREIERGRDGSPMVPSYARVSHQLLNEVPTSIEHFVTLWETAGIVGMNR